MDWSPISDFSVGTKECLFYSPFSVSCPTCIFRISTQGYRFLESASIATKKNIDYIYGGTAVYRVRNKIKGKLH